MKVFPGTHAVVIGAGGLGPIGIQSLAAITSVDITVVDRSEAALELARELGATHTNDVVWGLVGHEVQSALQRAGLPLNREKFRGIPTAKEIDRLVRVIAANDSDVEARATAQAPAATMAGGLPTLAGTALAELSWGVLWDNALPALDAAREHVVTPAVEKVVEANTLLSELGFESGGLAAAHAIHNGLTAAHQTHGLAHGQKVNIGSVTELVLEGAPAQEIRDFIEFTTGVRLPNTLTEVGLKVTDEEDLMKVATAATAPGETIHNMPFEISVGDLVSALKTTVRSARLNREAASVEAPAV